MSYSKILKQLVTESNLTYAQIIEECKKNGPSIDKSYLSKLINNRISPPSDEVSRALEKVFKVQPNTLVVEAYFDKAPRQVKQFIERTKDEIFDFSVAEIGFFDDEHEEIISEYREEFDKQPIINYLPTSANIGNDEKYKSSFYRDNGIEYEININDDGIEPIIPKGTNITIEGCQSYKNGDIVVVKLNLLSDKNIVVRKYYKISDDVIILIPANFNVEPILLTDEPYMIMGKVKSYHVDIN